MFTGRSLHSRLVLATSEWKRQQKLFDEFTQSLRVQPGLEKDWTDMVLAWEKDPTQKNPYVSLVSRKSVQIHRYYEKLTIHCRCFAK
jgi:hypothetical protein